MAKDELIQLSPAELKKIVEEMVAARLQDQTGNLGLLREIVQSAKPVVANNPEYSEVTPFTHPEGERFHPGPKLARRTFFCGGREREETLKHEEINAYNAITESCVARGGLWQAEVRGSGPDSVLHVYVPSKTGDQRMELPSLLEILRELAGAPRLPSAVSLDARVKELEERLAAHGLASVPAAP